MRTVLRMTVTALAVSLCFTATARATVVSGTVTDPAGDGQNHNDVSPWDLASYALTYDDEGVLTVRVRFHPVDSQFDFTWRIFASIGVWSPTTRACDVTSTGGVLLAVHGTDAPPSEPDAFYSVVGFEGGVEHSLAVPVVYGFPEMTFPDIADAAAFARRGYNCVVDVRLRNGAGGMDDAPGPICMSPSGTVPCDRVVSPPIAIRWISPRDGQTVSGSLHEGPDDCLAESTGPIVRTENWIDGAFHDRQVNFPWGCEIDTTTLADGPHALTVKAFAADGRSVEHTIRIHVSNGRSDAPPPPASAPATGTTSPTSPGQPAAPSPVAVISPAGGDPGAGGGGGGTDDDTAAPQRLTIARARSLGRRALAARYGRAFKNRSHYRLTCQAVTARRISCRVRWRYRQWIYQGAVRIRRTGTRDSAVVDVTRRRAGRGSVGAPPQSGKRTGRPLRNAMGTEGSVAIGRST